MTSLTCPQCNSDSLFRDGFRQQSSGEKVQRYLCRECGYRFSKLKPLQVFPERLLNNPKDIVTGSQICAQEAKNLETAEKASTAGISLEQQTRKGLIINFLLYLKKQGFRPATIKNRAELISSLQNQCVDLNNPEDVKFAIADKKCGEGYKKNLVLAYDTLLRMQGKTWDKPKYKPDSKLPFVPLESEIDQVVNSAGRRTSTFLATLKETGADPGEALAIEWIDVDSEKKTVIINHPVKGHKPRIINVSSSLITRLEAMPKITDKIFNVKMRTLLKNYGMQRITAAKKFNNPRLRKIKFTTFRHWKATMEYHKTKDILWVMRLLGHNSLKTTLIYIDLEIALFKEINDGFTAKVATTLEEACGLIEVGFEFVCDMDDKKTFQKTQIDLQFFQKDQQFGGTVGGFRRSVLKNLNGWAASVLAEDTDLTFRVYLAGYKVQYCVDAECYEEAVDTWHSYWRQRSRWAKGHMQCFFKHSSSVLKSKNLDLKQKIDGLMLLSVYFMPILALLSLIVGLPLIFLGSPIVIALWVSVPISLYCFVGNFAPFFEVGVGLYLDGRTRTQWLIPLLIFTFFFNIPLCLKAFFEVLSSKILRKDKNVWVKTVHSGNRNCYIAS